MELRGLLPRVKRTAVAKVAAQCTSLLQIDTSITECNACPRLVQWREEVAVVKRKAYLNHDYWGKPISGFGDSKPRLLIIGLAPGAHGANRTGRVFTGDPSGDWLFGSLHRLGIAKIPTSTGREDGQKLKQTRITTAVRCAPPDNKPSNEERDKCSPWLLREFEIAQSTTRAFVGLGGFAWSALIKALRELGHPIPTVKFGHGATYTYSHNGNEYMLIASYHPSQQNTFTGKLTEKMLDSVLQKAGTFAHVI
ncbi:MAG: uracil-DNA glycosylase [Actinobacteria bacterium]|uniref:Type-5 uracil-DNA glycosylase n=1 Tax=freshwater metagenome TaxID=449393 RepID=A0A6J7CAL7_9ZZZZ|nr:uracil-DNA glycosylase [Actinomycetota bacterium]MSX24188.1 uracil-DNA glycosylase [Actinomycetota bacterium]MSY56753.1 uracil-DNA glycosylase [Actinomycetota bacterium]MTB00322.1 uracil-DNA glycosylase [Actinomycetota bacterium]